MFLGYNSNGFAHHRLDDAISILADLGYRGIAITLDINHLDPFAPDLSSRTAAVRKQLERHNMSCVVETGARFILDPFRKHQPTLIGSTTSERDIRLDFLKRCVEVAVELNAGCVSFWSGTATDTPSHEIQMHRLVEGCRELTEYAERKQMLLAFEPEPGMFIDTMDKFAELHRWVNHRNFGLTIDIGHLVCNGELPVSEFLVNWKPWIWNTHIEDMRPGIHDHLMFGEGEVDFEDVFAGLRAANYRGGVFVELSRHSFDAVQTTRKAIAFLDHYMRIF
jgi:L-ribulose-5-phosphate 3-epimerase